MKIDAGWDENAVDISAETAAIMAMANVLYGAFTPDEYRKVIIPMTIIRRFECALHPRKLAVVQHHEKYPDSPRQKLEEIAGTRFYNTSPWTLAKVVASDTLVAENFNNYLDGFSPNVKLIIEKLSFRGYIKKLAEKKLLSGILHLASSWDLDPKKIDSIKMGYVFEDLIRQFSENAPAGDHYTGRDIGKLMSAILLAGASDSYLKGTKVVNVADIACGTAGLLVTFENYMRHVNPSAIVNLFGQEINDESFAIALAEMLIRGQDPDNICLQDTMQKDCFEDIFCDFMIMNPPFGESWAKTKEIETAVRDEHKKGAEGRWGAGLPATGDMQLLFVQAAVAKLKPTGRCAIIENGSPLFTGGASSGESAIRQWLLDNDYLEAIVQLPNDLFYNTGITTYVWILAKDKSPERKGKVALINASEMCVKLRKSLGNKRVEISPEMREKIVKLYADFTDVEGLCQIHPNADFKYREYTVMQPLQRSYGFGERRVERMLAKGALNKIYDPAKVAELEAIPPSDLKAKDAAQLQLFHDSYGRYVEIVDALKGADDTTVYPNPESFHGRLTEVLSDFDLPKAILDKIQDGLSEMDKSADVQTDKKGNVIWDKETKDAEIVPFTESIDSYMAREVLPHVPDAQAMPDCKVGAEIPFTRFFYTYEKPEPAATVLTRIVSRQSEIAAAFKELSK